MAASNEINYPRVLKHLLGVAVLLLSYEGLRAVLLSSSGIDLGVALHVVLALMGLNFSIRLFSGKRLLGLWLLVWALPQLVVVMARETAVIYPKPLSLFDLTLAIRWPVFFHFATANGYVEIGLNLVALVFVLAALLLLVRERQEQKHNPVLDQEFVD